MLPGPPTAVRRSDVLVILCGLSLWASGVWDGVTLDHPVVMLCSPSPQAPDMSSSEEFPSFGAQVAPKTLPWGPKR